MAKSSSPRVLKGLLGLHCNYNNHLQVLYRSKSSSSSTRSRSLLHNPPSSSPSSSSSSSFSSSRTSSTSVKPYAQSELPALFSNLGLSQLRSKTPISPSQMSSSFFSTSRIFTNSKHLMSSRTSLTTATSTLGLLKVNGSGSYSAVRSFSFTNKFGNAKFAKTVVDKPLSAVRSSISRYREAVGLQFEAFWKNNSLILLGAGGVLMCAFLWRVMFGIANTFVGLSEGMAKYGFLALSSAIVAFTGLYFRSRFTINPDKVYRITMRKLNTSAGILEVMGAPLSGTDLRAYVMSGGGLSLKNFKPTLRSKRCFLIFPIRGSERKGLVSVEVKKKKGQYDMKLLAIDIPMATGPDQRIFLIGDEEEYKVGGGLIADLRDPVVKAMAATKEFEDLDEMEEEVDAQRELQEAERKHHEEIEKLEKEER